MLPPLRHIFPQFPQNLALFRPAVAQFLIAHGGLLICALFLLAGLNLAGDYGLDPDEPNQRETAAANLDYILGRAASIESWNYHDRVYGVAFELPLLLIERALGLTDSYQIHRLRLTLTHLFFILGAFCCYRLAYHLFGSRALALFALLIFLLHPRIYAQSFFNSKDPVFLSMFSIALYLLERAFRRDTAAAFLLLGVAVGLLTNLRIMGIMLFPAVIAMRGLDLLYAPTGPERKGALLTAGLFILAAVLTVYALSPYAWTNPLDYLTASLALTANHPTVLNQLFQGEWIPSDQLPPHYTVTWFSITMPPPFLLLGGSGAAIGAAGLRRPGGLFRNTRRRFALLLLACFLLPPLAAILLGSNQHQDWRHFYFLYAPFGLLAAGGLGWLAAALARRRLGWVGVYGLTGLGLGLILLQMTQLHPLQYIYFNFLADRTAPEYLRAQYGLDYGHFAPRAAWQSLLARHPGEIVAVRGAALQAETLPAAARQRLRFNDARRNADYELLLSHQLDSGQPDLAFNAAYRRRIYNNTLIVLRPLDSARMTPAAAAAYQEIYRQAGAGEPIIRADYDVYRKGQRLTFVKENCPLEDRDARFVVKMLPPAGAGYSREGARPRAFNNNRVRLGELCLAVIQLPDYVAGVLIIAQYHLEQFEAAGLVWAELYDLAPPGLREKIAQRRQESPPPPPNAFAVFLDQDAGGDYRLLYAKGDCDPREYETGIFLHIIPESRADLPFYQWQSGVDNREFRLLRYGVRRGGECIAVYPLPDYPIAAILTGQAGVWEKNLYPPAEPSALRATYAALAAVQPKARANFDLYLRDNRLVYLRESCAAADTAANFFLHIIPADVGDLPAERQDAGFANRDFAFDRYGGHFDGKCIALVPLPDYPIAAVRTGQYVAGQGEVWAVDLAVGR